MTGNFFIYQTSKCVKARKYWSDNKATLFGSKNRKSDRQLQLIINELR
jgi:hypothetical protein